MSGRERGYRAALAHAVGRRVFGASAVSVLGDYVGQGALLLVAYERSGDRAIGAAALYAVSALPALLSGTLAGSWLDQIPRGRAWALLQLAGAVFISLPVLFGGLPVVFVAAGLLGAVRAATTAVRSGALADAVPDEHRGPLIGLLGTTQSLSEVIGYLSGATLTVLVGASPALVVDAATFLIGGAVIATTTFPPPHVRERRPPVLAGFREIASNPVLRLLAPLAAVTAAVASIPEVLAAEATQDAPEWTPYILASGPLGNAIAMTLLGRLEHVRRPSVQLIHFVTLALAFGLGAFVSAPWQLLLVNVAVGAGLAWLLGPQLTFMNEAPPERMAQVTGAMMSLLILAEGVGAPTFAALADRATVGTAYNRAGAVVLIAALLGWLIKERTPSARALDLPPEAPRLFEVWTSRRPSGQ